MGRAARSPSPFRLSFAPLFAPPSPVGEPRRRGPAGRSSRSSGRQGRRGRMGRRDGRRDDGLHGAAAAGGGGGVRGGQLVALEVLPLLRSHKGTGAIDVKLLCVTNSLNEAQSPAFGTF